MHRFESSFILFTSYWIYWWINPRHPYHAWYWISTMSYLLIGVKSTYKIKKDREKPLTFLLLLSKFETRLHSVLFLFKKKNGRKFTWFGSKNVSISVFRCLHNFIASQITFRYVLGWIQIKLHVHCSYCFYVYISSSYIRLLKEIIALL